jgi:AcrR family transcriptional regulator
MSDVARHAGVSRQAVYLHFADRTELLVEVSRQADAQARTPERQRRVDEAPSAREAVLAAIAVQAEIKPQLRGIATALDILRRTDEAAHAAWQEREHARLARCRDLVRRLKAEADLAPGYSVEAGAQLLWAVTSQRVWDDLVVDQGWSKARYRALMTRLIDDALMRDH